LNFVRCFFVIGMYSLWHVPSTTVDCPPPMDVDLSSIVDVDSALAPAKCRVVAFDVAGVSPITLL